MVTWEYSCSWNSRNGLSGVLYMYVVTMACTLVINTQKAISVQGIVKMALLIGKITGILHL